VTWRNRRQMYEGVSKSFRTGRLERGLQTVQISVTTCSCIAILWISLVSFVAVTLCIACQRCFLLLLLFISLSTQSGNLWIHSRPYLAADRCCLFQLHAISGYSNERRLIKTVSKQRHWK